MSTNAPARKPRAEPAALWLMSLMAMALAFATIVTTRAQQTQFQSILAASHSGLLDPLNRAVNNFNVLGGTRLDFSNGNLQTTGNALDLALEAVEGSARA